MRTLSTLLLFAGASLAAAHCAGAQSMRVTHDEVAEASCPMPTTARGVGPVENTVTTVPATISLGTTDAIGPGAIQSTAAPPRTAPSGYGSSAASIFTTPPPVVITDGPTSTIGGGGSGFTIGPNAAQPRP